MNGCDSATSSCTIKTWYNPAAPEIYSYYYVLSQEMMLTEVHSIRIIKFVVEQKPESQP